MTAPRNGHTGCADSRGGRPGPRGGRRYLLSTLVVTLGLAAGLPAPAQSPPTPEQQTRLEAVALAKARTEAYRRLGALPCGPDLTLGDGLVGHVDLDRALRQWVRARPRHGAVRLYSDGVCECDVRLAPEEIRDQLGRSAADHPHPEWNADRLDRLAADWPPIHVTGRATLDEIAAASGPAGWEDVTAEGQELARAAARADAQAALLTEVGRLKVTHARRLHEFFDSDPAVRAAVREELERVTAARVELAPDQLAVVEVRVSLRDLLRIVTRVHQEHYRGADFEAADFRQMVLLANREEMSATGLAPPPARTILTTRYEPLELDVPPWAAATLTALGRYEPTDTESPDEATRREAARLDALDRLYAQMTKLVIKDDVTVGAFLSYHSELKNDVALFLSGARPAGRPVTKPDGTTELKVDLPLRRLWEILRRAMTVEEVEPPVLPPSTPPTAPGAE